MGDVAIGDTATATSDRYLYFGTDGNVTAEYMKFTETGACHGFYFSDSVTADGYTDYSSVYENNALNALSKIKKEKNVTKNKNGFAKLDHKSLPAGVLSEWVERRWRNGENVLQDPDFQPSIGSLDTTWIADSSWVEFDSTWNYFQRAIVPSYADSKNHITNCELILSNKEGRNISKLISVMVKAIQELVAKNEAQDIIIADLMQRIEALEK